MVNLYFDKITRRWVAEVDKAEDMDEAVKRILQKTGEDSEVCEFERDNRSIVIRDSLLGWDIGLVVVREG